MTEIDERAVADALVCTDPVELGSILFTLVEPDREHAAEYNRWYERDHFYSGCMIGAYNFSGGRFACTRELKALRYPEDSPVAPDGDGSYLALYWILRGHHREWNRWARRQVKALVDADRMFPHRRHVHTQLYEYRRCVARDEDGVPPELALDRRFPGLAVVVGHATGGDRAALVDRLERGVVPELLRGSDAALCLTFTPFPMPPGQPSDVPSSADDESRFLQLWFCDGEITAAWNRTLVPLRERYSDAGADVLFASPFVPTVPGTDRFVGELW